MKKSLLFCIFHGSLLLNVSSICSGDKDTEHNMQHHAKPDQQSGRRTYEAYVPKSAQQQQQSGRGTYEAYVPKSAQQQQQSGRGTYEAYVPKSAQLEQLEQQQQLEQLELLLEQKLEQLEQQQQLQRRQQEQLDQQRLEQQQQGQQQRQRQEQLQQQLENQRQEQLELAFKQRGQARAPGLSCDDAPTNNTTNNHLRETILENFATFAIVGTVMDPVLGRLLPVDIASATSTAAATAVLKTHQICSKSKCPTIPESKKILANAVIDGTWQYTGIKAASLVLFILEETIGIKPSSATREDIKKRTGQVLAATLGTMCKELVADSKVLN